MFDVNLGKSRLAYGSMSAVKAGLERWETQAEIDACLRANDVSATQLARWRREYKLFPEVEQIPHQYRGSETHYQLGTCAQIAATARLFEDKSRVEYVGRQLWWEGFKVDERYWRPQLEKSARLFDGTLLRIRQFQGRNDADDNEATLQERIARSGHSNIVMSRIRARLSSEYLAAHFGVVISVANGDFTVFPLPGPNESEAFDRMATIDAMDIRTSESDAVLGQRLKLTTLLPVVLRELAEAFGSISLLDIAQGPERIIFDARDDVRNGLRIALALHDATKWFYGPKAFGLRLAAWVAKKQPQTLVDMMTLGFAALRQQSYALLSSAQIGDLASKTEQVRCDSLRIQDLGRDDPRFAKVFSPKRVRKGMRDIPSYNNWIKEIALARGDTGSRTKTS